ncbi:centromere protein O isoform X1 [Brachionichthys hirsutus]|uniref:centromere protein O isoform X1 n=1 Tax=Brachionichthys hirsutus TaxID=412623 RepID=UPI0036050301
MEAASAKGVIGHLTLLEAKARSREVQPEQRSSVSGLRAKVKALTAQRDRLKAEIETYKKLQKIRSVMDEEEEDMDEDSENSELLRLMARHEQLKDLLYAHRLIGRYDLVTTHQGQGLCVSLPTCYQGVLLETYNLEIDLKPTLRIARHNVPPFIPLKSLEERSGLRTDPRAFLDLLGRHLNAFVGRKQQLKFVKELHPSVEVAESNMLCSKLVMIFAAPAGKKAVLCSLDYTDHARCLPTGVRVESEDESLLDSSSWKKVHGLLMETPVHQVLITMKKMKIIV